MNLEFYRPTLEALTPYIEGYYFIAPGTHADNLHYWTFPNNYFIVSVSQGVTIEMEKNRLLVRPSAQQTVLSNFVSRYTTPIEVLYDGPILEITIYFKPLGINHFIENPHSLFERNTALDFNPFSDFIPNMNEILSTSDRSLQRKKLEAYWLSKLQIREFRHLKEVLFALESEEKIEDIAHRHGFSRQYLSKLFNKVIGKSPVEYRKIHRFRAAIANQKNMKSLTELSYESMFYDQSHLIKDFKQLTSVNPCTFFKKVDTNQECLWLFI
ncbi:AraC family transcriptional regulator [Siphonobacter sp. SORGH_AS_1065]|uniref:helix-turn-helix domain-containing protein n=1 Tax=Siphonobacter sp. SORGH_AS_1065 TaxID=3041795 RepID=UPI00278A9E3E|nr:helix-turn-helix domain-containing protein [Siphonobacter sp. SORGH_AS_1065]MDQ1090567.1 AraC-like DNA-binding protein [Siphonobacter sp. SORGH_AS_1065]